VLTDANGRQYGRIYDVDLRRKVVGIGQEMSAMIILGIVLLVIGLVTKISILTTVGVILLVVGAILTLLGATGRAVGGRRSYY
jgi:membrane-bound ClpP family serine protease